MLKHRKLSYALIGLPALLMAASPLFAQQAGQAKPAPTQQAVQQPTAPPKPPVNLLDDTKEMGKEVRDGKFKGEFIVMAQQKASDQLKNFPDLISIQKIARSRQNPGAPARQHIDSVDVEVGLSTGPNGQMIETRNICLIQQDDTHFWKSHVEGDLDVRFEKPAGLQVTGVYAASMNIPFSNKSQPPVEVTKPNEDIVAMGPKGVDPSKVRTFSFDTALNNADKATRTFVKFKDSRAISEMGDIPGKGYVYFDSETGAMLKLVVDGYGFKEGTTTQYMREEIEYGDTQIQGTEEHFWLPKSAAVAIGASTSEYQINRIEYVSYRHFTAESTLSFEGFDNPADPKASEKSIAKKTSAACNSGK